MAPRRRNAHAARSAKNARNAITNGRIVPTPSSRGRPRHVASHDGKNGARSAARAARARAESRKPSKRGRPPIRPPSNSRKRKYEKFLQSTSSDSANAIAAAEPTCLACAGSAPNIRCPKHRGLAVLVELWCESSSRTSRAVAARKGAAVRVCQAAPGAPLQPAPRLSDLRPGSQICWPVNLRQAAHKRAVARFIKDLCKAASAKRAPKTKARIHSKVLPTSGSWLC